jgi:DNA modification methylase
MKLFHGPCEQVLKNLPNDYLDAVVTDPPYGLAFMGKKWDYDVPSVEIWREIFRVLKPGGHVLSFGGTRTYHRMVVNIEDAGFEIRDQVQWIYGSGFPKSTDVSKRIDKEAGAERETYEVPRNGGPAGKSAHIGQISADRKSGVGLASDPSTDAAKKWQGWGTALKPANEPICLARKPLEKGLTVAENVLKWGCGAINVDASRIEAADQAVLDAAVKRMTGNVVQQENATGNFVSGSKEIKPNSAQGRWPANLLLDETAAEMLDAQSGELKGPWGKNSKQNVGVDGATSMFNLGGVNSQNELRGQETGGASRFFYVAKSSKRERNAGLDGMPLREAPGSKRSTPAEGRESALGQPRQNHHPTVKPVKLMEYLIKLITPPGGTVLDPFMGSGSTGVAARNLGFDFIGVEMNEEYFEIAKKRIDPKETVPNEAHCS